MMTRRQYMDALTGCKSSETNNLHNAYYLDIAETLRLSLALDPVLPRVASALRDGDEYLNEIHLPFWDALGRSLMAVNGSAVRAAFAERGDSVSLAGLVCLLKAAARRDALALEEV